MFRTKKREDHAGSEEPEESSRQLDFAWLVFMGLQMGYTEKEVSRMYLGKWLELYTHFKWFHNFKMKRCIFEEKRKVSLLDL